MGKNKKENCKLPEIRNAKAGRDFFLGDRFEAGLVLTGTEVKAIRQGRINISDSFVRIDKDNIPTLYHSHISEYDFGNTNNHNPYRPRKLLLKQREISKLVGEIQSGGQTIVPTKIYFKHGLIKLEIALAKGKKLFDKRGDLKERDDDRHIRRVLLKRI